jgi:hypothetical protein
MPSNKGDDKIVLPNDLSTLTDDELSALHTRASEQFDAAYGEGTAISDDTLLALNDLAATIRTLAAEVHERTDASTARRDEANALAEQVRSMSATTDNDEPDDGEGDEDDTADEDTEDDTEDENPDVVPGTESAVVVAASGAARTQVRVPKNRRQPKVRLGGDKSMKDVAYATADLAGYSANQPVVWDDAGVMLDKRLAGFNKAVYQAAAARGQHMREQHSLMAFRRPIPQDLIVTGENADDVMKRATDMTRLPGQSLVAAGWCAPSEVLYDLCNTGASRDGLLSIPEIGISRGGIRWPVAPTFADVYNEIVGFHFTEADAIAENYAPGANAGAPNVAGPKPCYEIPCPTWDEARLEGDGLCITGDIIQMRGYPEMMAFYLSNALIAHDHRMSARDISRLVAGSTAVTMATDTVGTIAPLLAAIELQAEHIRYTGRLSRGFTLEAVFPYWIRGAIRQDLSVRLGSDQGDLNITDAQVDGWFRSRGISPQFVYDWQPLDALGVAAFKTWPATVQFLIYPAGTWVRGVDDIITLDNIYDSVQLGMNKYTALFTEEASLIAQRCFESRVVTVPVVSDGSTHAGVLLDADLGATAAA